MSKIDSLNLMVHERFRFDGNAIREHVILAEMINKGMERRHIPWEIVQEQA
jgi:hypothetical protein